MYEQGPVIALLILSDSIVAQDQCLGLVFKLRAIVSPGKQQDRDVSSFNNFVLFALSLQTMFDCLALSDSPPVMP